MKYVIQYAMIYYAWKFKNHDYFHHIDYHKFMEDLFNIYNAFSKVDSDEILPCSGRACYNLENITKLNSFCNSDRVKTPIDVDPKGLLDSIRYTAKRLFIGSILSSYFGKLSKSIVDKDIYYKIDDNGNIDINSTLETVIPAIGYDNIKDIPIFDKHIHTKFKSKNDQEYNDKIFHKILQPYYNPFEILFQNIDTQNCYLYDVKYESNNGTLKTINRSYRYDFGLFSKSSGTKQFLNFEYDPENPFGSNYDYKDIISFDFYSFDGNQNISKTTTIGRFDQFGNFNNCTMGSSHILFDYHDEMDILKIYFNKNATNTAEITNIGGRDNYVNKQIQNIKGYTRPNNDTSMNNLYFDKLFNKIYNEYILDKVTQTRNFSVEDKFISNF